MTRNAGNNLERLLRIICGASVAAILLAKIPLVWRININWDEFYFLNQVHAFARGELDVLLQGAYAYAFLWATWLNTDEIGQIGVLRLSMWPLLALSCFLLYRLARRWASATGAWVSVMAFIASWPALKHGASFRADSLLLPLTLSALLLAGSGYRAWRRDVGAGLAFGLAMSLTIKAALMLPALVAVFLFESRRDREPANAQTVELLRRLAVIGCVAALLFALILAVHAGFVIEAAQGPDAIAMRAMSATLLDVPWFPRWSYFPKLFAIDPLLWLLLASGVVAALVRKRHGAAVCALSLLPIVIYRNAYPYYYVVMLAPACAAVAVAVDGIRAIAAHSGRALAGTAATGVLFMLLARSAWDHVMTLRFDEQGAQRAVVSAVHRIFPMAVPYIDHSGMIASFRKVNFFMSTWGVENYLRAGRDFMPATLEKHRPPLLLVNHNILRPGAPLFRELRDVDRKLLAESYVPYWGPIRVAGIDAQVPPGQPIRARLPFPGRYRMESVDGIWINGEFVRRGGTIDSGDHVDLVLEAIRESGNVTAVRLVWAEAKDPPPEDPPVLPLYSPLL